MIGIVNYGLGNIKAFCSSFRLLNIPHVVLSDPKAFIGVTKLILPGVGSFDHAMNCLNDSGMRGPLTELVMERSIPVLGVCVGMQIMGRFSEEGALPGLGWIDGAVRKINVVKGADRLALPHMGWNSIDFRANGIIASNFAQNPNFYFLHSFGFFCSKREDVVGTTDYGVTFDSIVNFRNIYGIQCHPEKSHKNGLTLLNNFSKL